MYIYIYICHGGGPLLSGPEQRSHVSVSPPPRTRPPTSGAARIERL